MHKGTYLLVLALDAAKQIEVGALGVWRFDPGIYAYAGSAMGPGGLKARLARHRRKDPGKSLHWHIDYLRQHARVLETWQTPGLDRLECSWAQTLATMPGARIAAPGFGASDCSCETHLFHFAAYDAFRAAHRALGGPAIQPLSQPGAR